jgi:hypothetical protein
MAILRQIPAGDLALENGSYLVIDGVDMVRQKLASRFRFFLGEWFLDRRQGIPYYRDVLKKDADLDVVRSVFRKVVLGTPGVTGLRRFDLRFDAVERHLVFDFEASSLDGTIFVTPEDRDFIVRFP